MNYLLHLGVVIAIYVILAESLNLAAGYGGMLSLAHAAFYALGAYSAALLLTKWELSFLLTLPLAMVFTGVVSLLIGWVSLRFRGDFFILATLSFQAIVSTVLHNWDYLTGGPYGITGIPKPSVFGVVCARLELFTPLAYVVLLLVVLGIAHLVRSPYGRVLQAVREDQLAAASLGKNVLFFKASAFVMSGSLAAVAGVLYATYYGYIDPTSFTLEESVFIFAVLVVGGMGNLRGPLVGAVLLVLLPEVLRFLQVPDAIGGSLRQMIYGGLLVIMMFFRPQGVAGRYAFE